MLDRSEEYGVHSDEAAGMRPPSLRDDGLTLLLTASKKTDAFAGRFRLRPYLTAVSSQHSCCGLRYKHATGMFA